MQFEKVDKILSKTTHRSRLEDFTKSFAQKTTKETDKEDLFQFNTNPSTLRSTKLLKTNIETFINDRKVMGKGNRCMTTNESLDEYFSKSKGKRQDLINKKNKTMKLSTMPYFQNYVKVQESAGKRDNINSCRSPNQYRNKKTLSEMRPPNIKIDTQCKESVSTLQTPGRINKNKNIQMIYDLIKQVQAENFDFIRKIGNGKFSEVYLVKDRKTHFLGALKIIRKSQLNSEKMINQFVREIKIHSHVKHPNIINLYGSFFDDGNVYLLQEYGNGGQLYKKMKTAGSFSEKAVSFIIRSVINAVKYLHSKKILHRDIKPQNIVLVEGTVKICDFGWAVYEPSKLRQTLCGTPIYTCPELVKGQKYSNKIDLWTIGMLTFQLFFGHIPFKIRQKDDLSRIATDEISFPANCKCSPQFQDFVLQLLKKNPRERLTAEIMLLHPFIQKHIKVQICQELC